MISRLILFFSVLTIVTSCRTLPTSNYQDERLNFRISEDFTIVSSKIHRRDHATHIKLDCRNEYLFANLSITWLPGNFDLDHELDLSVESIKKAYKKDKHNTPVFGEYKSTQFGPNSARQVTYVVDNEGPKIGSFIAFHCDDITIIVGEHYLAETEAMMNKCRTLIEQTYGCGSKKG